MAKVNTIRKKNVIRYNNDPCVVLECAIRTPPNLTSFCQMQLRNLVNGKAIHVRCPVSESFEILPTEQRKVEFSYENQGVYAFMDDDTFELIELNRDTIEDAVNYLVPGQKYELQYIDSSPFNINLPSAIEMKVIEAPDAVRGDTSGNVQKPVTVETGFTVNVPLFIKEGETIRISTDDGSYLGRA